MKSSLRLTFKNSFKNAFQSLSQFFGLVGLITLLALIVSLMTAISSNVINNYRGLVADSNLRTMVVDMNTDTRVKTGNDPTAPNTPKNNVGAQQYYIYQLNKKYETQDPHLVFDWSRTEERNFSGLKNGSYDLKVKTVAKTTPKNSQRAVDKLVVGTGHDIQTLKQTVIDATFAKRNNIKIGDILRYQADDLGSQLQVRSSANEQTSPEDYQRIQQIKNLDDPEDIYNQVYSTYNWFQVVGFGESADYVMPTMDAQTPLANKKTELIAYVDPILFGLIPQNDEFGFVYFEEARMILGVGSSADRDGYYSIRLRDDHGSYNKKVNQNDVDKINRDLKVLTGRNNLDQQLVFSFSDKNYKYSGRVLSIISVLNIYNLIAGILLISVFGVTIFTIGLITRKQVEKTRSQLGLMKALGYQKRVMIFNYSVLPFVSSVFGSILGFLIAQTLQPLIIDDLFGTYFNLDFPSWRFDWIGFIIVILIMWLIITGIAFLIAFLIMRDDTLNLINGNKISKISRAGRLIKKMDLRKTPFSKMRASLLGSSLGKMSAVSFVVLLSTILMTISFAAPNLLKDNQTKSYTGINYEQLVDFGQPTYNNPYSFMQTYDPAEQGYAHHFAPGLNKITGLSTSGTDPNNQNYDMDKIIDQLLSFKIPNSYYGLEVNTSNSNGIPEATEVLFANQKMLNARSVVLDNHFLRQIADWAQLDSFGWKILTNQWPDYLKMTEQIRQNEADYTANPNDDTYLELLKKDFIIMQAFYRVYTESVGLTISRDYYYNEPGGMDAYLKHDYSSQIEIYNDSLTGRQNGFTNFTKETMGLIGTKKTFGEELAKLTLTGDIKISPGKDQNNPDNKLPINRLYREGDGSLESGNDIYLSLNPDEIANQPDGTNKLKSYLSDLMFWYSSYFSQRSGIAVVQAAFSRPPYFVRQLFKDAYNANDVNKTYNLGFGIASFNPEKEQLGTKLNLESQTGLNFSLYGIENNHRFVDLKANDGTDLIKALFTSALDNGVIVNQSLATKLNLKVGSVLDANVLYNELAYHDETNQTDTSYKLSDWKQPTKRSGVSHNNFISRNDLDNFSTTITNPDGSVRRVSAGNLNITNAPSEYYLDVLAGKIHNVKKTQRKTFRVLGIHDGYGPAQGWVRNDTAIAAMKYNQTQNYLWENFFAPQFAAEFMKSEYDKKGMKFDQDLQTISYQKFLVIVNDPRSSQQPQAQKINELFNHAYPIFNYKYSLSDDIGDLKVGISTFQEYGDYSPIAMNGGMSNGINYDGMGASSIANLIPIRISKGILVQLSSVIEGVLILIIVMLVIMTFIIILLTTSLIISDNLRFISTMKVLGYTNREIANVVLGMYAIVIIIMFVIGYIGGWFIFARIVHTIAMTTSFVLPIIYPIWLVFAVIAGIIGIYIVNFVVGYRGVMKNNATSVLQNQEI